MRKDITWEQQISDLLTKLLGNDEWNALVGPLREYEALGQAVLTIFGVYDSGKSTLLKRLIVDDGKTVPGWVTISARRETFEVNTIKLSWAIIRDTPGLAGGNAEHEKIALEALMLSDAVLLVLPPQLLTGERETIVALLQGTHFNSVAALPLPKDALYIAIARMDEAGTDPSENISGYKDLCKRKITELCDQLQRTDVQFNKHQINCVAADPYQQVGNRDVTLKEYDEFRSWDGISTLYDQLSIIGKNLPTLRVQSRVRYLASLASTALSDLMKRKNEVEAAITESRNGQERLALIRKQHNGLMAAARADLDGVVNEVLRSSALAGLGSNDEVVKMIEPRMNKAFDEWQSKHVTELEKLARDADVELKARTKRPGAKILKEVFKRDKEKAPNTKAPDIGKIGNSLRKGLRSYHEWQLGMSLSKADEELKKLSRFPSFEDYRDVARGGSSLKNAEHAAQARRAVGLNKSLEILGPAIFELGGLLLEERAKRKAVKERAIRREKLQAKIHDVAKDVADQFWKDFETQGTDLGQWIQEQEGILTDIIKPLDTEHKMIVTSVAEFNELLTSAPGAVQGSDWANTSQD